MHRQYLEVGLNVLSITIGGFLLSYAAREVIAKDSWYTGFKMVLIAFGVLLALVAISLVAAYILGWLWCKAMDGITYLYRIRTRRGGL